jgi:hypothetical protein
MTERSLLKTSSHILRLLAPALLAAAAFVFVSAPQAAAQDEKGAGATVGGEAKAKDVGLPLYPGATRYRDKDNDTDANFNLWGGGAGFKLVVIKMQSSDAPDKVAAYYKKALAKYGPVLDCTHATGSSDSDSDKSNVLTCGTDKADSGGQLYKAGTKDKQHIVAVNPSSSGTKFDLLYITHWNKDEKK